MTSREQLGKLAQEQLGLDAPPSLHTVQTDPTADHSDEAAEIVRASVARFSTGEMDALSSAESFFDVYFGVKKNTDARPAFLRKVADDETMDYLFDYISVDGDATIRRVSLGLLNRLATEPTVGAFLTTEARLAKLLSNGTQVCKTANVQDKLMWLETINSILPRALNLKSLGDEVIKSGFAQAALTNMEVWTSENDRTCTEEEVVYGELLGLLASKCLGFLMDSILVSETLGMEYLEKHFNLLGQRSTWKRPEVVATHARLMLQNHARLSKEWKIIEAKKTPVLKAAKNTVASYAEKDWRACRDFVAFFGEKCAECGKSSEEEKKSKLLLCAQCRTARYCNTTCQKEGWFQHKGVCVPLRKE